MELSNPFPLEVKLWYEGCWECLICHSNGSNRGGLSLHHIYGRKSNSIFNAAVLCGFCHGTMGHSQEEHVLLVKRNLVYLKVQRDLWDKPYYLIHEDERFFREVVGEQDVFLINVAKTLA